MRFVHPYSKICASRRFSFLFIFNLFLLVLVFIIFLPVFLKPSGLFMELPRALTSEPVSRQDLSISIFKDDLIALNGRRVTPADLEAVLRSQKPPVKQVLIKADIRARIGTLVRVWDLLRSSGVSRIAIATNE